MTDKEIDELLAAHGYVLGGEGMRQALERIPSGLAPLLLFFALDAEKLMRSTRLRVSLRHCTVAVNGVLVLALRFAHKTPDEVRHEANRIANIVCKTSEQTCHQCAYTSADLVCSNLVLCEHCAKKIKAESAQALAEEQRQCA